MVRTSRFAVRTAVMIIGITLIILFTLPAKASYIETNSSSFDNYNFDRSNITSITGAVNQTENINVTISNIRADVRVEGMDYVIQLLIAITMFVVAIFCLDLWAFYHYTFGSGKHD